MIPAPLMLELLLVLLLHERISGRMIPNAIPVGVGSHLLYLCRKLFLPAECPCRPYYYPDFRNRHIICTYPKK